MKNREKTRLAERKSVAKYPEKDKARRITRKAIKMGLILKKPCMICKDKAQAHHPDYSTPLKIIWLCTGHHKQVHAFPSLLIKNY